MDYWNSLNHLLCIEVWKKLLRAAIKTTHNTCDSIALFIDYKPYEIVDKKHDHKDIPSPLLSINLTDRSGNALLCTQLNSKVNSRHDYLSVDVIMNVFNGKNLENRLVIAKCCNSNC